jgi:hypothetical protein
MNLPATPTSRVSSALGVKITPPSRRLTTTLDLSRAELGLRILAKYAISEKLPSGKVQGSLLEGVPGTGGVGLLILVLANLRGLKGACSGRQKASLTGRYAKTRSICL